MREQGALLGLRERVAVYFEDAARERLKLLRRHIDHAPAFAPLDDRQAPRLVFEVDIGKRLPLRA